MTVLKDVSIIMYSHHDYGDVWPMFTGQIDKYIAPGVKRLIFCNPTTNIIPDNWHLIQYEENLAYNKKVYECLDKVDTEFCLYHQEDMPLYDAPNIKAIETFLPEISKGEIDFVKLIKGGLNDDTPYDFLKSPYLFKIPKNAQYLYANQPSVWKTSRLKQVFEHTFSPTIREFETGAQATCRSLNIKGCYTYNNESKRGELHWDSSIYPYVATAIVKGKWNTSQYPFELGTLFKEYGLNPSTRGEI
jgi:hypothetical protein|tara:strand:- start:394 stop:1131 length:738 start_codon:yes stop_codon:yes gene_type:complete